MVACFGNDGLVRQPRFAPETLEQGVAAITVEDFRWGRCDIKSIALLANVLMKQQAADRNATEAIIVRNGEALEGASTSLFIVLDGALITPPNSTRILPGTTRDVALELSPGIIPTIVRPIRVEELRRADEIWLSAATRDIIPVSRLDDQPVGGGRPGPMWRTISQRFRELRQQLSKLPAM